MIIEEPGVNQGRLPEPALVTGATGNVGGALVEHLLATGHKVRALVRSVDRAKSLLDPSVELFVGDITLPETITEAVSGAGTVIHAAGLPEQWHANPDIFDQVNGAGTINVADAALKANVRSFIYVSTIDVFVWSPGRPFDETIDPSPKHTRYERSKQFADRAVVDRMEFGLPARFVCPAGVFGPAPTLTPGVNQLLADLVANDIPMLLPGGLPMVFNRDVARGIVQIGLGPIGSRAILSGPYKTLLQIAVEVRQAAGSSKVPRVLPSWFAHVVSRIGEKLATRTGKPPLIPDGALHFLECHVVPDSSHAVSEFGWSPTPFDEAVAETVHWLRDR